MWNMGFCMDSAKLDVTGHPIASNPILQTVREHRKLGGCLLQGFQAAPKIFRSMWAHDGSIYVRIRQVWTDVLMMRTCQFLCEQQ